MFNKLILAAGAFLASSFLADATMAPSYPSPGTVWKTGQQYDILWDDDKTSPSIATGWKNFKIDFMTGDNNQQVFLTNVASNLDGSKLTKYTWTAPEVKPNAAIYFFMFTNDAGDSAWTTRFGITGADGKLAEPEHPTQPSGEKIPWGTGALASNATASGNATQSASSSAAASSSAVSSSAVSSSASVASAASAGSSSSAGASKASESAKPSNGAGALQPLTGMALMAMAVALFV